MKSTCKLEDKEDYLNKSYLSESSEARLLSEVESKALEGLGLTGCIQCMDRATIGMCSPLISAGGQTIIRAMKMLLCKIKQKQVTILQFMVLHVGVFLFSHVRNWANISAHMRYCKYERKYMRSYKRLP